MRQIHTTQIQNAVRALCQDVNLVLPTAVQQALAKSLEQEESSLGCWALRDILENSRLAQQESIPLCQDTGMVVVFLEIGQEVQIIGGDLTDAINAGVQQGYQQGYLRKSVVEGLANRRNTGDNTPAVLHCSIVPGRVLRIQLMAKGSGSENMSAIRMLNPSEGVAGIRDFMLEVVTRAGANACPPVIVGIGIGGTFEKAAILAKQALFQPLDQPNSDPQLAQWEDEFLAQLNALGIGPQGFGGRITAIRVHILTFPTHMACFPVAVNLNCHCARYKEAYL